MNGAFTVARCMWKTGLWSADKSMAHIVDSGLDEDYSPEETLELIKRQDFIAKSQEWEKGEGGCVNFANGYQQLKGYPGRAVSIVN